MRDRILEAAAIAISHGADRVIPLAEWAALVGVSSATAKRLIATGKGPRIVRLSKRRVGIRASEHARWLDQQTEANKKTSQLMETAEELRELL